MDGISGPPRKWLDKRKYFRVDPQTNKPQLIRVEPVIEAGNFDPDTVKVYLDEDLMIMEREAAEAYLLSMGVTPIEEFPQWWKHQHQNG